MVRLVKREILWWLGLGGLLAIFALSTYGLYKTLTPRLTASNDPIVAIPPAAILLDYARNYAMSNSGEIATGVAVQSNGVRIEPGTKLGEARSPTPAQLSAMGFAKASAPKGLITIDVTPKGCVFPDCAFDITVISEGSRRSEKFGGSDMFKRAGDERNPEWKRKSLSTYQPPLK